MPSKVAVQMDLIRFYTHAKTPPPDTCSHKVGAHPSYRRRDQRLHFDGPGGGRGVTLRGSNRLLRDFTMAHEHSKCTQSEPRDP